MSNSMATLEALYEEAQTLVQQELTLLDKDDIGDLEGITQKREALMAQMWSMRHECDEERFLELLRNLLTAQQRLIGKAHMEQDNLRGHLQIRKKQNGYFANAQKQAAHSDKAFYMNKVS